MALIELLLESRLFKPNYSEEEGDTNFSSKLSKDQKQGLTPYHGRNVVWYGNKGRVIKMHKDDVYPVDGNIFYDDKLTNVKNIIEESEDKVELMCGYGVPSIVDLDDIRESIEYKDDMVYEPFSTGVDELDLYLSTNKSHYISDNFPTIEEFCEAKFTTLATGEFDEQEIRNKFEEYLEKKIDQDEHDEAENEYELWIELENDLKEVVEDKDGDIGRIVMQIRDGNHRIFGSIEAGEDYVFVDVEESRLNELDPEIKNQLL